LVGAVSAPKFGWTTAGVVVGIVALVVVELEVTSVSYCLIVSPAFLLRIRRGCSIATQQKRLYRFIGRAICDGAEWVKGWL
jgi:hypothetical protein